MPETPNYGLPVCLFVHCLLCGQHHAGINHYCEHCMTTRFEDVERDAKIRSYSGNWSIIAVCSHDDEKRK